MRLLILVIMILGIGIGWLWWSQQRETASPAWQGYAEADYVKVAPVEQGLLTGISVARGDQVAAGAPLFTQDDTHDRAARDQAARQLAQAKEQLANLEAAMKPTEVTQAEANLVDARSTLERARADSSATRRCCGLDTPPRKPSTSVERIICQRKPRRGTRKRPLRKRKPQWAEDGRSKRSAQRSRHRAQLWRWPSGGWRSAPSPHPLAAASPTSWRNPARRWRQEHLSYRFCRRKISLS